MTAPEYRFLHAADLHLDSPMLGLEEYEGAPVQELRGSTRRALKNLVDLALAEQAAFVLIAGDLYDGDWRDYNTGLFFISQVRRLREAGIRVFIIAGNHDAASRITKTLRMPEGVYLFPSDRAQTIRLDELNVAVHGQSFPSASVRRDLSAGYPERVEGCFNIGLLHTCATGREGHESYAPCTVEGLLSKGYDYWALGHVHRREILSEDPPVVFPGNAQGRHPGESGPKGCMLVKVAGSGEIKTAFRPLDVARWFTLRIDASTAEDGYQAVDLVMDGLDGLLQANPGLPLAVRVEISGESKAHEDLASDVEKWTEEIRAGALDAGGGMVYVEKVKIRTSTPFDLRRLWKGSGPVRELLDTISDLEADPEELKELGRVLEDLERKLPRELKQLGEASLFRDPDRIRGVLEQIRPMLVKRLIKEEGAQ
ncbi:MAG: exonuclease SbcCD subunit D [Desulfobacteraceae bacterium]